MSAMDPITITRTLLRSAKEIAHNELDAPNTDVVLAIFYRICVERDRVHELLYSEGVGRSEGPIH